MTNPTNDYISTLFIGLLNSNAKTIEINTNNLLLFGQAVLSLRESMKNTNKTLNDFELKFGPSCKNFEEAKNLVKEQSEIKEVTTNVSRGKPSPQ